MLTNSWTIFPLLDCNKGPLTQSPADQGFVVEFILNNCTKLFQDINCFPGSAFKGSVCQPFSLTCCRKNPHFLMLPPCPCGQPGLIILFVLFFTPTGFWTEAFGWKGLAVPSFWIINKTMQARFMIPLWNKSTIKDKRGRTSYIFHCFNTNTMNDLQSCHFPSLHWREQTYSTQRPDSDGRRLASRIRVCRVFPYIICLSVSLPICISVRQFAPALHHFSPKIPLINVQSRRGEQSRETLS